ncbi:MAG: alpha-lytic protease prodomain-containing protein [Austwickia sp.]|jgi:streptogrisin C|nr:MAG: alpha-lytic protease prodomain-containing protein [Austwickia sp.]
MRASSVRTVEEIPVRPLVRRCASVAGLAVGLSLGLTAATGPDAATEPALAGRADAVTATEPALAGRADAVTATDRAARAEDEHGPTPQVLAAALTLADRVGARFGGSYWDAAAAQMVVRVAPGSAGSSGAPAAGDDVRLEPTTYPLAELRELAASLAADDRPDVAELYVDPVAGRVVVAARPGRSEQLTAGIHDDRVVVREVASEPVRPAGGSPLVGGGAACTMGFTGTRRGVPVFLTAGHCGREGTTFTSDGRSAGRITDVVFPESDYAVGVFEGSGPRGSVAAGTLAAVPVRGSLEAPVGSRVCSMGSSSGWACGAIVATGVTVRYGSGATTQYVRGLTKVDVCRSGGDSGGPWLWGTQAQGLTSGGAGQHGPGCAGAQGDQVAYFQPINPVLDATGVVLDTVDP